jgi:Capsule assembly protein Wzi
MLFALMMSQIATAQSQNSRPDSAGSTRMRQSPPSDSVRMPGPSALILVTSETVDQLRTRQLRKGVERGQSLLLRSASSLTPSMESTTGAWRRAAISPQFLGVVNTAIPFSQNYGSLWAGTGISTRTLFGFKIESPRVRIILAPELIVSTNSDWVLRHGYPAPPLPPDRSQYDFPFYIGRFTIDQPMRFGNHAIGKIDPGETTVIWSGNRLALGFSNESEWWGPGIRNAIVLSNNAPGFPHFFIRTARPLATKLGDVEIRWLVGGLMESPYFDTVSTNNTRSIAAIATTLQTHWDPNLSVGLARSVYATATGWGQVPWRWFDVFARTHTDVPDTTRTQRDQLFTLFARWIFPADGVELYGEWGRLELQPSLRDFLLSPNHTQGYTLGLQWRAPEWRGGTFRLQPEITQLEQSATFRDRPGGSWYTSQRVIQGYTNRGEPIGASIGPGASSQWFALDYLKPAWRFGAFLGRIRWNEDVHSNFGFPVPRAYCNHDVTLYSGIRGAKTGTLGTISADLSVQSRENAFFQNGGGCPNNGPRLDIRNHTLSVTFTPW